MTEVRGLTLGVDPYNDVKTKDSTQAPPDSFQGLLDALKLTNQYAKEHTITLRRRNIQQQKGQTPASNLAQTALPKVNNNGYYGQETPSTKL